MSIDYTVKAYPTTYRGRLYRSRLEARWAAFFDELKWPHEYEPFDLGRWSPDFQLTGCEDSIALVEIKPITDFDQETAEKMTSAIEAVGRDDRIFLFGVSPRKVWLSTGGAGIQIGWQAGRYYPFNQETREYDPEKEPVWHWHEAFLAWGHDSDVPIIRPDVYDYDPRAYGFSGFFTYACGSLRDQNNRPNWFRLNGIGYFDYSMELWARASNEVQWRPGA